MGHSLICANLKAVCRDHKNERGNIKSNLVAVAVGVVVAVGVGVAVVVAVAGAVVFAGIR